VAVRDAIYGWLLHCGLDAEARAWIRRHPFRLAAALTLYVVAILPLELAAELGDWLGWRLSALARRGRTGLIRRFGEPGA
jgi:lauroyl/myristoyl acyltransferase